MNQVNKKIITRFPPSPTGNLHIGNIRTLLFNYLFTRHHRGSIVMRFEDTDIQRSKREYEVVAIETLKDLGLDFDEGPFRQSERIQQYKEALEKLIADDKAYIAEASEGDKGGNVIRFRNPNKSLTFTDIIRGAITIDTTDFGDFIIARSLNNPLYHLSVVVDDIDMRITHVIRGEDHITSTPRQILLIEALGGTIPHYAHLPLIIGEDRKKLGKRHGATTYQEFKNLGVLPEALLNYLALLGWNPGDDREFFTKDELIDAFSLERVHSAPAMFSYEKLASMNKHYLELLDEKTYTEKLSIILNNAVGKRLIDLERFDDIVTYIFRERLSLLSEATDMITNGELEWLFTRPLYTCEDIIWKNTTKSDTAKHISRSISLLSKEETWGTPDDVKNLLWEYAEEQGRGEVLWPIRYVLTGLAKSPDPFTVAFLIGKEETLTRLKNALTLIQ